MGLASFNRMRKIEAEKLKNNTTLEMPNETDNTQSALEDNPTAKRQPRDGRNNDRRNT